MSNQPLKRLFAFSNLSIYILFSANPANCMLALQSPLAVKPSKKPLIYNPGVEIPGGSGFYLCPESAYTDLMEIDHMEMVPSPPIINEGLNIEIYGSFMKDITPNATWDYQLYWTDQKDDGSMKGTAWFCDAMELIQQPNGKKNSCPPEKGGSITSILEWVPGKRYFGFLGGDYIVKIDAKTAEGERIYCMTSKFYMLPEKE